MKLIINFNVCRIKHINTINMQKLKIHFKTTKKKKHFKILNAFWFLVIHVY